jgi:hypothetical protein
VHCTVLGRLEVRSRVGASSGMHHRGIDYQLFGEMYRLVWREKRCVLTKCWSPPRLAASYPYDHNPHTTVKTPNVVPSDIESANPTEAWTDVRIVVVVVLSCAVCFAMGWSPVQRVLLNVRAVSKFWIGADHRVKFVTAESRVKLNEI